MSTKNRPLIVLCLVALCMAGAHAQTNPTILPAAPSLGLTRLIEQGRPADVAPLSAARVSIDPLPADAAAAGGASRRRKNDVDYVALEAGRTWSRPLRGSAREATYASFVVHGSQNSLIEVGGARLGVTAGPVAGSLQLMFDDSSNGTLQWKSLNIHIATALFENQPMAALSVLTVALEPDAGVWHLYAGSRLIADHLPLIAARRDSRHFTVTAGQAGAWIAGLVLADENPLYEDDNFNGTDDRFERHVRAGTLLPATATLPERRLLAQQWQAEQRARPPAALTVQRPLADRR